MKSKIAFFLVQYLIFCSRYDFSSGLVGRNVREAEEGQYKSVVCILRFSNNPRRNRYDVRCTGTLITRSHVLSSEHCFTNLGTRSLYVLAESVDLRRATPYYIAWWITYILWATAENIPIQHYHNDVAIIKLTSQVSTSISVSYISPDANENLFGLDVVMAGWGKLADGLSPNIMHVVEVTVISNEDCETTAARILGRHLALNDRYLCSLSIPWALMNSGDSGGPLLYGNFILGINQGTCPDTPNPLDPRKANLHCSVNYYRQFIERNMIL